MNQNAMVTAENNALKNDLTSLKTRPNGEQTAPTNAAPPSRTKFERNANTGHATPHQSRVKPQRDQEDTRRGRNANKVVNGQQ